MEISDCLRRQIESDLGLNVWLERGQDIPVRNCWHFSTDGKAVEVLFFDKDDYRDAMNRLFIMARRYGVVILAFVLMDTHVHFILYGPESECSRAVHDFVKRTSMSISARHGLRHQLFQLPVHRQHRNELCRDLFNRPDARSLCMADRIRLARALRSRYGSSPRQIARVCGLIYSEVKDLL